jgi:ubiquitin carboxyl-terminal hydrolase 7
VVTDDSFKDYQGYNLGLVDDSMEEVSPGIDILKALKTQKISAFKQQLAEHYKLEPEQFRLWALAYRANESLRVDKPLQSAEDRVCKVFFFILFILVLFLLKKKKKKKKIF